MNVWVFESMEVIYFFWKIFNDHGDIHACLFTNHIYLDQRKHTSIYIYIYSNGVSCPACRRVVVAVLIPIALPWGPKLLGIVMRLVISGATTIFQLLLGFRSIYIGSCKVLMCLFVFGPGGLSKKRSVYDRYIVSHFSV